MPANLLLGLLLTTTTLMAAVPPDRSQPAEDPCALGRRIAQSPPCLADPAACEALDLWRKSFGVPDIHPAGVGQLPPELASRLPNIRVHLGKVTSYEDAFQRLGAVSGFEVVVHPGLKEEKFDGAFGPMPVERAWKVLLNLGGGFLTHFDGERLLVTQTPSARPQVPGRSRSLRNCPAR